LQLYQGIKSKINNFTELKNASWLIGEKIIVMLLTLVVNIFIARHLGVSNFGLLNYLLAITSLFMPFFSLGFNAIVTRELVSKPANEIEIIATVITFRFISGLLVLVFISVLVYFGYFNQLAYYYWALFLFIGVNVFSAFQVLDFWFQAKLWSKYIVKARVIVLLFIGATKLFLVFLNADFSAFIWLSAIEFLCISLAYLITYLFCSGRFSFSQVNFLYGFNLLSQSKWLIFSGIAAVVYLKIDQLMLAEMVSTTEVGKYAVASRMSEVWYFFPIAIVSSYFPSLIKTKTVNLRFYQTKLQQLCDVLFVGALFLALLTSFYAGNIINLLFGYQYRGAEDILALHIWAGVFVFMRALLSKWLLAEHLVKFSLLTHGIGAFVNVVLNYYLIPQYHGVGAAMATVVSYAFASYFVLFFHKSTRPMAMLMTRSILFPIRVLLPNERN